MPAHSKQTEIRQALNEYIVGGDESIYGDLERGNHIIQLTNPQGGTPSIIYDPTNNPIIADFHNDRESLFKALWSPYGSGTTSAICYELLVMYPLFRVLPNTKPDKDGVYRIKLESAMMRSTLRELLRGAWRSIGMIVPPSMDISYHTAKSAVVYKHTYKNFNGKTVEVDGQIDFVGLDKSGSEKQIPSLIVDVVAINEPRVVKYELAEELFRRAGRFCEHTNPALILLEGNPPGPMWKGYSDMGGLPSEAILGTAQPRTFGLKDQSEKGYKHITQEEITKKDGSKGHITKASWWYPGGDTIFAANRHNLPDGYYDQMKNDPMSKERPTCMVCRIKGADGDPVFDVFSQTTHIDKRPVGGSRR